MATNATNATNAKKKRRKRAKKLYGKAAKEILMLEDAFALFTTVMATNHASKKSDMDTLELIGSYTNHTTEIIVSLLKKHGAVIADLPMEVSDETGSLH